MSSIIDPAKLKVVDLRNELASRGLDTKGNKAVLVKRLKDALEKELDTEIPDTTILDTSTEDTSISEEKDDKSSTIQATEQEEVPVTKVESKQETIGEPAIVKKMEDTESVSSEHGEQSNENEAKLISETKIEENEEEKSQMDVEETGKIENEDGTVAEAAIDDSKQKGEKRKRSSASPERSQKRKSRSPIREDEPEIDIEKVQLNWFDSDLHLEVDKGTFLSAKPFNEGAFGYAWAGVRASHGISFGKVWYEVKLTEELKWEDFSQYVERPRYDRRNQRRDRDRHDSSRRDQENDKAENKSEENKEKETTAEDLENKEQQQEENKDNEEKQEDPLASSEQKDEEAPASSEQKDNEEVPASSEQMDTNEAPAPSEQKDKEEAPVSSEQHDAEMPEENEPKDVEMKNPEESAEQNDGKEADKKEDNSEPFPGHLFRLGWSLMSSNLQLGEDKFSYGFESTGKFVTDKTFVSYGKPFKCGDVIGAFLEINDSDVSIRYTLNGEVLPIAITIPKSEFPEDNFALFPHVLTRNFVFEVNFGEKEEPWFALPEELSDFIFISKAENAVLGPSRPEKRADCEVILMCGLPGCGKTHWVKEHIGANIEKRYTILGSNSLLEKMTIGGEPLKSKYKGRWASFIDRLQKSLNKLISLAALRRRNYIIDQTNVFPSAQRRKMRPFEGFQRKAVVIVLGDEEQLKRQALQEAADGKEVPDSTILEMKASMSLPEKGEWIEEVIFAGLTEEEAKDQVKKYNTTGKEAGYGAEKRFHKDRWSNKRNDYRGRNFRDRGYQHPRYESRGGRWQQRGRGGWRDRRDFRRPPPPNRDWRTSSGGNRGWDRGPDNHNRKNYQGGSGNRPRGQGWSGGSGSSWGQGWNQQSYGNGNYGNWGNGSGNQWKYNQGGYGGYGGGGNWNYYGQYPQQNWSNQGQQQALPASWSGSNVASNQHNYNTHEAWAQYAKQYAQQIQVDQQNQDASVSKK